MKRTLVLSLAASALLYGCTQPVATVEETTPVSRNMFTEEIPAAPTFEQMRGIVAEVLGDAAAARIAPTSRYVRVQFASTSQMLAEINREAFVYSQTPIAGAVVERYTQSSDADRPAPMYAVVESDRTLPEELEYEVVAEYFDPASPLADLTAEQAAAVERACMQRFVKTRADLSDYDWYPWGRIEYKDDLTGEYYPVANARIILQGYKGGAPTTLQTETCRTDENGDFRATKQFFGVVAEWVEWSSVYWSILSDNANVATTGEMVDRKKWSCILSSYKKTRDIHYATAHLATRYMFQKGFPVGYCVPKGFVGITCLDESVPIGGDDKCALDEENPNKAKIVIYCKNKTPLETRLALNRLVGKAMQLQVLTDNNKDLTTYSRIMTESWREFTRYYFTENYYSDLKALDKLHTYTDNYVAIYDSEVQETDHINLQN